nr:unnamed protein product [Callosobruchus analis]
MDNVPDIAGSGIEQVWIQISLNSLKFTVGVLYKPPNVSHGSLEIIGDALSIVYPMSSETIVMGDLNINLLNENAIDVKSFKRLADSFNLTQIVQEATRISDSSHTLLDIILVSNANAVSRTGAVLLPAVSDHLLTFCCLELPSICHSPKTVTYGDLKNMDLNLMNDICSNVNWSYIEQLNDIDTKISLPPELNDPNEFNNVFISSIPSCKPSLDYIAKYRESRSSQARTELNLSTITDKDILNAISLIKSNAAGGDGFSLDIIELFLPHCICSLKHLFNYSIINGIFPSSWKIAIVLPLPKKQNISSYGDCRPISILNVMSKILERIIQSQLVEHINNNHLLPHNQSGFRKGHSTVTTVLDVADDILKGFDEGKITTALFLDYTKAFDLIDHQLLLNKLWHFGLSERSIKWFENYLCGRKQMVKLVMENGNSSMSDCRDVSCGVPQGSILGPTLFALYISDLPSALNYCKCHYYADDGQIYYTYSLQYVNQASDYINSDLNRIVSFSEGHCLKLNPTKSVVIHFQTRTMVNFDVFMGGQALPIVDKVKNLGIVFDNKLSFKDHVTQIMKSSYSKLKHLYSYKLLLSIETKLKLIESLVLSAVQYGDVVFCPCLNTIEMNKLQKLHNSCIRFATNTPRRQHITPIYEHHKILKFKVLWILHLICLVHRIIVKQLPSYLNIRLVFRNSLHQTSLRFVQNTLDIPQHRTEIYKNSFTYNAAHYYNKIPPVLKTYSPQVFKNKVKKTVSVK